MVAVAMEPAAYFEREMMSDPTPSRTAISHRTVPGAGGHGSAPRRDGILQRKCACGTHTGGGECAKCNRSRRRPQLKLAVGARSDPLELEADRAAEAVASGRSISAKPALLPREQSEDPRERMRFSPTEEVADAGIIEAGLR